MRSNSGKDESRNNLRDPTLRDRANEKKRTSRPTGPRPRTTEMGSGARKTGERGTAR